MKVFRLVSACCLPLLTLAALPSLGAGTADSAENTGLTLTYTNIPPGSLPEGWSIDLQPDGRLTWTGVSRSSPSEPCVPESGVYSAEVDPTGHAKLARLARETMKEQEPLQKKEGGRAPFDRHDPILSLDVQSGQDFRALTIMDGGKERTAEFIASTKRAAEATFMSPYRALRFTARLAGGGIEALLSNVGAVELSLNLPAEAKEGFFVEVGGKRSALSYVSPPVKLDHRLKRKQELRLTLKLPNGRIPKGARIVYDNRAALHHSTLRPAPLKLKLCAKID